MQLDPRQGVGSSKENAPEEPGRFVVVEIEERFLASRGMTAGARDRA